MDYRAAMSKPPGAFSPSLQTVIINTRGKVAQHNIGLTSSGMTNPALSAAASGTLNPTPLTQGLGAEPVTTSIPFA